MPDFSTVGVFAAAALLGAAGMQDETAMAQGPVKLDPRTALEQIEAQPDSPRYVRADAREGLTTLFYAPRGADPQGPHGRDEVYVVVSGQGTFFNSGERVEFGPGDVLFAAAHAEHRFEDFSDDLGLWVFFYGEPVPGGEE